MLKPISWRNENKYMYKSEEESKRARNVSAMVVTSFCRSIYFQPSFPLLKPMSPSFLPPVFHHPSLLLRPTAPLCVATHLFPLMAGEGVKGTPHVVRLVSVDHHAFEDAKIGVSLNERLVVEPREDCFEEGLLLTGQASAGELWGLLVFVEQGRKGFGFPLHTSVIQIGFPVALCAS
jgi:hypothetical protein